jgi:hypothetical protein
MRIGRIVFCLLLCLVTVSCVTSQNTTLPQGTAVTSPESASPTVVPTDTRAADTPTPTGPLGSISGKIIPPYPDQNPIPASRIYAREVNTGWITAVELPEGQTDYTIPGVPEGVFEIVGWFYPKGQAGAYTSSKIILAETSGDQFKCTTSLERIMMKAGNMEVKGIDIACWGGDFFFVLTPMP